MVKYLHLQVENLRKLTSIINSVATKHGISGFSKVVALEYAGTGVTCNVICPGFVLTELIQKQIDEIAQRQNIPLEQATEELVASKHPSKKFSKPEDIAAMCAFLCGEAGDNITGAEITMDGGWTVQ
jgi:3-hydroxybutyrate dehydrogenase